jgi:hypothetical protein
MFLQFIIINTNEDTFKSTEEITAWYDNNPTIKAFNRLRDESIAKGLILESEIIINEENYNSHKIRRTFPSYGAYLEHVLTISDELSDSIVAMLREKGWTITFTLNEVDNNGEVTALSTV